MSNTVITIARQYGSGGRTVGKMLAKRLDIPCYDREIISLASEESGIHNCASDLRCRTILCTRNRYFYLVRTPQTVSDQNLTACCDGIKAV